MAVVTLENRLPRRRFKPAQLKADGWLRPVQPPSDAGDALLFHKQYEGSEQSDFQRAAHDQT